MGFFKNTCVSVLGETLLSGRESHGGPPPPHPAALACVGFRSVSFGSRTVHALEILPKGLSGWGGRPGRAGGWGPTLRAQPGPQPRDPPSCQRSAGPELGGVSPALGPSGRVLEPSGGEAAGWALPSPPRDVRDPQPALTPYRRAPSNTAVCHFAFRPGLCPRSHSGAADAGPGLGLMGVGAPPASAPMRPDSLSAAVFCPAAG